MIIFKPACIPMQMNDLHHKLRRSQMHTCTHSRENHLLGWLYTTVIRSLGVAINLPYTHCTLDGSQFPGCVKNLRCDVQQTQAEHWREADPIESCGRSRELSHTSKTGECTGVLHLTELWSLTF